MAALPWPPSGRLDPEMAEAFAGAIARLRKQGFKIEDVNPPRIFRQISDAILELMAWEAAQIHGERLDRYGDRMGRKLAELIRRGIDTTEVVYNQSRQTIAEAVKAYESFSEKYPICLTPAAPGAAPQGIQSTGDPRCNAPWTSIGAPAISIRMAQAANRLPLGLQITAWKGRDALVLSVAAALEEALQTRS